MGHEDAAGAGQIHRHQSVQQSSRDPALRHQPPESRLGRESLIEVQGVVIPRNGGVRLDRFAGHGQAALCLCAYRRIRHGVLADELGTKVARLIGRPARGQVLTVVLRVKSQRNQHRSVLC